MTDTDYPEQTERTLDISNGDDLDPHINGINDNERIIVPDGTYKLSSTTHVDADNWNFVGNGATVETEGRIEIQLNGKDWSFGNLNIEPQNDDAPNDWCQIRVTDGEGWRLHNLAWTKQLRTQYTAGNNQRMSCILPGVDKGGEGVIEDCWFGEGCDPEHGTSVIACWGTVDGTVRIKRSYFYRTGVYGANSSTEKIRNEGVTHFEDCYFQDCYIHCMRTGSHYEPAHIKRCVATISDRENIPTREGIDGHYSRGVYAYHGPVIIEDTHLNMGPDRAIDVSTQHDIRRQATVEMTGGALKGRVKNEEFVTLNDVGDDPKTTPPEACVTSAEEAYKVDTNNDDTMTDRTERVMDISDGENIEPYIEEVSDNERVIVPAGVYEIDRHFGTQADNFEIIGADGAVLKPTSEGVIYQPQGENWSFGGFLIDNKGKKDLRLIPDGRDYRVHDIGWENNMNFPHYTINPNCESGSEATFENLYCPGTNVASSLVFIYKQTDGIVNFINVYANQRGSYGVFTEVPDEGEGVTRYYNCFFKDSYLASIRTGSENYRGIVDGCVLVYSDDETLTPAVGWDNTSNISDDSARGHRNIWAWRGDIEVTDCDMTNPHGGAIVAYDGDGEKKVDQVVARNNNIDAEHPFINEHLIDHDGTGGDPSTVPPEGCPASAREAATTGVSTGSSIDDGSGTESGESPSMANQVSFSGRSIVTVTGNGTAANYVIETEGGTIKEAPDVEGEAGLEKWDTVSDNQVSGWVTSGTNVDKLLVTGDWTLRVKNASEISESEMPDFNVEVLGTYTQEEAEQIEASFETATAALSEAKSIMNKDE